jgi:hypothetical protein
MSVSAGEARPNCETEIIGEKFCSCFGFGGDGTDEGQSGHDELKKRGKTGDGGVEEGEGDGGDDDGGGDDDEKRRIRRTNGNWKYVLCKILVHLFRMRMI